MLKTLYIPNESEHIFRFAKDAELEMFSLLTAAGGNEAFIARLGRAFPRLKHLGFRNSAVEPSLNAIVAGFPFLESLVIVTRNLPLTEHADLGKMEHLSYFSYSNGGGAICEENILSLGRSATTRRSMRRLAVPPRSLSEAGFKAIGQLRGLRALYLGDSTAWTPMSPMPPVVATPDKDTFLFHLSSLSALEEFTSYDCQSSCTITTLLSVLPRHLTHLRIGYHPAAACGGTQRSDMVSLAGAFPLLKEFNYWFSEPCNLIDDDFHVFGQLKHLESVSIMSWSTAHMSSSRVSEASLKIFKGLPSFRSFSACCVKKPKFLKQWQQEKPWLYYNV